MKFFSLVLTFTLISAQTVVAQDQHDSNQQLAVEDIESAQSTLAKQYAILADLKESVNRATANKKAAWIGIAVSSTVIAAGIFGLTRKAMEAVGKKAITFTSSTRFEGGEIWAATLDLDTILIVGGLAGTAGSTTVVAVEAAYGVYLSAAIAKQMEKISATQALLLKSNRSN